jgi:RHS repeat-associated protein
MNRTNFGPLALLALSFTVTVSANSPSARAVVVRTVEASDPQVTKYIYDVRNLLVEVQRGDQILGRFQYDFEGRLIKKIGSSGIRQYVYDGKRVAAEYDGNGNLVASYAYGAEDRLIAITWAVEGRRYVSMDGLGSITTLTDDAGHAVASYHFDAWGRLRFDGELAASENRVLFTGHRYDDELQVYNANARRLDPMTGRFMTQDPAPPKLENPSTLNRYVYVSNRPTHFTDPTGMYEADVHYGETKALALKAGLKESVAELIARGAENPDRKGDPREPVSNGISLKVRGGDVQKQAAGRLTEWHFPRDPGSAEVVPNSAAAQSKLNDAMKSGDPITIGESLHPFEDSWSHQGVPSIHGVAGHPNTRGGYLSEKADHTAEFPDDALQMSQQVYTRMVELRTKHPELADKPAQKFDDFKPQVETFIAAQTIDKKQDALKKLGVEMPKELWYDVTLPTQKRLTPIEKR